MPSGNVSIKEFGHEFPRVSKMQADRDNFQFSGIYYVTAPQINSVLIFHFPPAILKQGHCCSPEICYGVRVRVRMMMTISIRITVGVRRHLSKSSGDQSSQIWFKGRGGILPQRKRHHSQLLQPVFNTLSKY